jgi:hypothetical protein
MDPPYENKDLLMTLSTTNHYRGVSEYMEKVRFLTEDQCNLTYQEPIVKEIPLGSGGSYNVTVPAKDIWYIAFLTTKSIARINVDFKVVDRPVNVSDSSPAFIPSLNLSVIVLLLLSLFVYRQ